MPAALMVAFNKSIATEFEAKLSRNSLPPVSFTPQQEAFISAFALAATKEGPSLIGEAVAGSGKTHTLLAAALSLGSSTTWTVKTLHGLGYSAWQDKIGRRLRISGGKMFTLLKELSVESELFSDILALAKMGKVAGIVPTPSPTLSPSKKATTLAEKGTTLFPDDSETWEEIAFQFDLQISPEILTGARRLILSSIEAAFTGYLDFDDMLYMPVCFRGVFRKYPLVVVDEAQDLSAIQQEMLRKSLPSSGRLVAVGDRNQAIYGFRGALAESIPDLIRDFQMQEFPLTVSFRCPRAIVEEARKTVPHIEPSPFAEQGEIIHHDKGLSLSEVPPVVLCRNTAPLISLALSLIASGRGATIKGREIGKTLITFVKTVSGEKKGKTSMPLVQFQQHLSLYVKNEIARKPFRESALVDQQNAILAICRRAENVIASPTTTHLIQIIEELYDDKTHSAILLSTIHKAKGLEWNEVLILDPQLIPSCYATQEWQLQQERNIRYVAVTRAKDILHFATSEEIFDDTGTELPETKGTTYAPEPTEEAPF